MPYRTILLEAGHRAAEILDDLKIRERIDSGYTRVDPVQIAYKSDVTIFFRPLEKLLGAFINDVQPGILVNVARPRGLVHMTCAHELGHYFLGHETMTDTKIDYDDQANLVERQADIFAYSLMAPKWLVVRLAKTKGWATVSFRNPAIVYQLSLRLGTSFIATVWTLSRYNFLSAADATAMAKMQLRNIKKNILGNIQVEDWNRDVWLLDKADQGFILEPSPTDGVVVALPNHAAAGYLWSIDEANAEGFHLVPELVNQDDQTANTNSEDLIVGSIGYTQYHLFKDDTGGLEYEKRKKVSLLEVRPWLDKSSAIDRYEIKAEYESLDQGLSPLEKRKRIQEASV